MNLSQLSASTLGALVMGLQNTIARINLVWGIEHQADGKHAIPQWRKLKFGEDFGASNFTASVSQTWTVSADDVRTFEFWKHGDTMMVSVYLSGTAVGGTPSTSLLFPIPGGFTAKESMFNVIVLEDAGTRAAGLMVVVKDSSSIVITRLDGAPFTNGAALVAGQLQFKTTR